MLTKVPGTPPLGTAKPDNSAEPDHAGEHHFIEGPNNSLRVKKSTNILLIKSDHKEVTSLHDDHKLAISYGEKLMEIVKKLRALDQLPAAVDTLQFGARMIALHFARQEALAEPHGGEIKGSSVNPFTDNRSRRERFDPEAKVVDMLKQGLGWRELEGRCFITIAMMKQVIKTLSETGVHDITFEANALESWLLSISTGLVSSQGFKDCKTAQDEGDLLGWRVHHNNRFEARMLNFLDHLRMLNRWREADTLRSMVDRLTEMGNQAATMKLQHRDLEEMIESVPPKDIVQIMMQEGWEQMGPVAADCVEQLDEVAMTLMREGFEDESLAVSGMLDELMHELLIQLTPIDGEGEGADDADMDGATAEDVPVDNGAGIGQIMVEA